MKSLTFVCNCHLQSTWFSASAHLSECICTSDICLFCTWRHLPSAKFSQMYNLIINKENIINIHKHSFFNGKCSTSWESNPLILQSSWVPYHLGHWHNLLLGTLPSESICTSDICSFCTRRHLPSATFSQMYNLILNEENIINIHEHSFSNEKCSTRWDLNPCISQSRQVPYYLEHWHHLFIGTIYASSDLKTLTFVCNCHLQSTWFSASVHLSFAYLSECIHTWDICLLCTWRYLSLAKFSQVFHLILNEQNIINIYKHTFCKETCHAKWDSYPPLLQSRRAPCHLKHWHHIFLHAPIQEFYADSDLKTLTLVWDCHLHSTWFGTCIHLSSSHLYVCICTSDICCFSTWSTYLQVNFLKCLINFFYFFIFFKFYIYFIFFCISFKLYSRFFLK